MENLNSSHESTYRQIGVDTLKMMIGGRLLKLSENSDDVQAIGSLKRRLFVVLFVRGGKKKRRKFVVLLVQRGENR